MKKHFCSGTWTAKKEPDRGFAFPILSKTLKDKTFWLYMLFRVYVNPKNELVLFAPFLSYKFTIKGVVLLYLYSVYLFNKCNKMPVLSACIREGVMRMRRAWGDGRGEDTRRRDYGDGEGL